MSRIAIVTHCRDRLADLQVTLPLFLSQVLPVDDFVGVVVVDYGSPNRCVSDWMTASTGGYLPRLVRVEAPAFNPCHSRNVGLLTAFDELRADFAMLVSCDMRPDDDGALARFAAKRCDGALMYPHILDANGNGSGWCETCLIEREAFRTVRGYDEAHTGYGHDDSNFYLRLRHWGFKIEYGPRTFTHIPHEPPQLDNAALSRQWGWAADMSRPCNPRGYGAVNS